MIDLSAQEQAFYGHICTAKDVTAEFFGTIVASTNIVLQHEHSQSLLLRYAALVDPKVHASPLLGPGAITAFFYQLSLAPIYVISTFYQIMLCRLSALVTTVEGTGG